MPQLYTTQDGINCRAVNSYELLDYNSRETYTHYTKESVEANNQLHYHFEATVKSYPLTKEMPIGSEFEGEVVWQYKKLFDQLWIIDINFCQFLETIQEFEADLKLASDDYEVRTAVKPSTAREKPVEAFDKNGDLNVGELGKQLEKDMANMPTIGLRFKQDEVWNAAIDEAVKMLSESRDVYTSIADKESEDLLQRNIGYGVSMELTNQINLLNSLRK